MYCVREVTEGLYWVGANDRRLVLFENCFPIPRGVSYNAYCLLDEKTVLFDTVDWSACRQLLENLDYVLGERPLDYLVVHHVEPDHAAGVEEVLLRYPNATLVTSQKALTMLGQFGVRPEQSRTLVVKEGDELSFGRHRVTFLMAPMVHWPEVMTTFDYTNGVLFSADAFGTFGALDGKLFADEVEFEREWLDEARRYYSNIVGKYGMQTQSLLKKVKGLGEQLRFICPLHGPVWRKDLSYFVEKYQIWSTYQPEKKGVVLIYASMYGNTENAAQALAARLCEKGVRGVEVFDISTTHASRLIGKIFEYSHLVLAGVTYNLAIYPAMHTLLTDMKALNVQNRTVALIENGSWACTCGEQMEKLLTEEMKNMTVLTPRLRVNSMLESNRAAELEALAEMIAESVRGTECNVDG